MKQLTFSRRLSLIHAVKCNKATSFEIARHSNDELKVFFNRLSSLPDNDLETFNTDVQTWMNAAPIVTENNIKELIK